MTRDKIEMKGLTILLGIFGTECYEYFDGQTNAKGWGYFRSLLPDTEGYTVIHTVKEVCEIADQIIFVLDLVQFPINPAQSITCEELELICSRPEFFNNTIFVKGHEVIDFDKNLVLNT